MRPEISVPYLEKAIRLAAVIGAPVVNTDEGIRPAWLEAEDETGKVTGTPRQAEDSLRHLSACLPRQAAAGV